MIKLFTGTNCTDLSKEVASILRIKVSELETVRFDNSELRIRIIDSVSGQNAFVIQSGSNPTNQSYMELFFIGDALKRSGAKKITAIIPYFGYARQDKQHRKGECVSAEVIIKFIESVGFNKVILFDIHEQKTLDIFKIQVTHLSSIDLLAEKTKLYFKSIDINPNNFIVVTPDQAGKKRAKRFSKTFFKNNKTQIAVIEKHRNLNKIHISKAVRLNGNVKNKIAIVVDDIITSGNTLLNATDLILKNGAKKVVTAIVHHDFSPDTHIKIQNSKIERFFTTNTIFLKEKQRINKIEEVSIAKIISSVITSSLD